MCLFCKRRCRVKDKDLLGVELNASGSQADFCQSKLLCNTAKKMMEVEMAKGKLQLWSPGVMRGLCLLLPAQDPANTGWSHSQHQINLWDHISGRPD